MPIKFDIDYTNDLTRFTLTGKVTYEDVKEILDPYRKSGTTHFSLAHPYNFHKF